ncbi:hypothetical protein [Streptomyces sp. NRRL F-5123]|uniref:hypothetical protein n=1 Tax=Streptomyces sp. NRRL F-5123 TaxID=1463856 RepID=UPI0004E0C0A1|nr:hypothetical protein [Streptomyces sp. NRRL F-5123]
MGPQLSELVALLDGLGLSDTSGFLLDHVVACLREQTGLLVTLAPALDRLGAALAAHGRYDDATWVTAASVEATPDRAAALANLAALTLRRGDTVGAAELAVEARRFAAPPESGDAAGLDVAVLEAAVSAEVARREGLHAHADRLVDELAGCVRRLAAMVGDDHPASLSALAALASAEFSSAEAAGERARMERAVDVLAVAAQRMSAVLGGHHPRALSVLRSLASAEYELARTSGDARRLDGAGALMAAAVRGTEARGTEALRREERSGFGERRRTVSAPRTDPSGAELKDAARSLISEAEFLLNGEAHEAVLHGADSATARLQYNVLALELLRAQDIVDDRPGTAYALVLDILHKIDVLLQARAPGGAPVPDPEADTLNSPRRPAP